MSVIIRDKNGVIKLYSKGAVIEIFYKSFKDVKLIHFYL